MVGVENGLFISFGCYLVVFLDGEEELVLLVICRMISVMLFCLLFLSVVESIVLIVVVGLRCLWRKCWML